MKRETTRIAPEEVEKQLEYCAQLKAVHAPMDRPPLAFVDTYGCQQNEADSQRIRGFLSQMGYEFTQKEKLADLIVLNTCAIRENAELRVLGNVGALVHGKRKNPNQIICLCGCMMQEPHMVEKIRQSFRHVDLVFGPHALWRFPELLWRIHANRGRIFETPDEAGSIVEGIPVVREGRSRAWVSIMYGCNNYCTYCIVPYVRGRERSRQPEDIVAEVQELADQGYAEITLLGQNVNSYGKDLDTPVDFAWLLEQVNAVPGDFLIRFMTSHPKDASLALFDAMAKLDKVAPQLHLPVQAGNDRVLAAMNRGYTSGEYLTLIQQVKARIPHISLTSDIIVGFPGETTQEFEDTLKLLEQVEYDALFTFIFSAREGTPAAKLPDPMPKEEKSANFQRLLDVQNAISAKRQASYVGQTLRCLVDNTSEDPRHNLSARTPGGRLVHLSGDESLVGQFVQVNITGSSTWALFGTVVETES